jgi:hypothetical protein
MLTEANEGNKDKISRRMEAVFPILHHGEPFKSSVSSEIDCRADETPLFPSFASVQGLFLASLSGTQQGAIPGQTRR